jgi:hypothetical protein
MNELAVTIGLISLPGLIATILADKLVVHIVRWEAFKYAVYTFVFGLGSYAALQALVLLLHLGERHLPFLPSEEPILATWAVLTTKGAQPALAEIVWATTLAPVVATVAILLGNRKWLNRVAQALRVSAKYGDENLYSYYLNLQGVEWVYVRDLPNDLSYRGIIHSFSETQQIQELVLREATVFQNKEGVELYSVPMLYLSQPLGSFIIEAAQEVTTEELNGEEGNQNQRGEGPHPSEGGADPHHE